MLLLLCGGGMRRAGGAARICGGFAGVTWVFYIHIDVTYWRVMQAAGVLYCVHKRMSLLRKAEAGGAWKLELETTYRFSVVVCPPAAFCPFLLFFYW